MTTATAILLFVSAASAAVTAGSTPKRELEPIYEAVFRHVFEHNGSGLQRNASAFFLAVGEEERDPSARLLKRLSSESVPVKGISASRYVYESGHLDNLTGKQGVKFFIKSVHWLSKDEAKVYAGYHEGSMSAKSGFYRIKRTKGIWLVTEIAGTFEVS